MSESKSIADLIHEYRDAKMAAAYAEAACSVDTSIRARVRKAGQDLLDRLYEPDLLVAIEDYASHRTLADQDADAELSAYKSADGLARLLTDR